MEITAGSTRRKGAGEAQEERGRTTEGLRHPPEKFGSHSERSGKWPEGLKERSNGMTLVFIGSLWVPSGQCAEREQKQWNQLGAAVIIPVRDRGSLGPWVAGEGAESGSVSFQIDGQADRQIDEVTDDR